MNASPARVTVLIPVHNRTHLLRATLDSVLKQTFRDWVVCLCDDGSTEDIQAVVSSYEEARFQYVPMEHAGIGATRNRGLQMVRTRYVVMLDSDDVWEPTFLEETVRFLDDNPSIDCVQTAQGIIDVSGKYLRTRTHLRDHVEGIPEGDAAVMGALDYFINEPFGQNNLSSLLIRSEAATAIPMSEIDFMEDWDYLIRLGQMGGQVARISDELCLYRMYSRDDDVVGQINNLRATIQMIKRHRFSQLRHRRVQRRIIGNMHEMVGFDYLQLHRNSLAARHFALSLIGGVGLRRIYGFMRCVAPRATSKVKRYLGKVVDGPADPV